MAGSRAAGAVSVDKFLRDSFLPRDPAVLEAMQRTSPKLTRRTTLWRAWIGFNASHSLGALLVGAFYLMLPALHPEVLRQSRSFAVLAVVIGCAYLLLAWRYWFRIPLIGLAVATLCFSLSALLLFLR